jgi:hypothetical protein
MLMSAKLKELSAQLEAIDTQEVRPAGVGPPLDG